MPDTVPIHFNAEGIADDWGAKWINAFILPSIGVAIYLLLLLIPKIDPKKNIENFQKPLAAVRILMALFFVAIYAFVMIQSLDQEVNMIMYVLIAIGGLIMILGNYMNSVKQNYFIGVKTPWTLESEYVWKKTHRLTSKLWVTAGLIIIGLSFVLAESSSAATIFISIVVLVSLIPVLYSYFLFKKENNIKSTV
jgi:uncharacterized membrane protein